MIRGLGVSIVLAILAAAAGVGMLLVKHGVKEQEALLAQRLHEIQRGQDDIHVLNAEWTYLSDPVRVAALAEKHLGMRVVAPTQIVTLDTLPASTVQTPPVTVAKADISRPPVVVKSAPVAKPEGVKPAAANAKLASVKPPAPKTPPPPTRVVRAAATSPPAAEPPSSARRIVVIASPYAGTDGREGR